ncbi:sugar phosphate isomerase/epimerase family protein [Parapedobacter sp. 10938]|uniref:sugar phosphate isomerase/epimerase family protein n=1 Tax=Parapedobacter flavus TaxID=3110225 RepID=UPI002DB94DB9|nr:TIM barrel protein [Parapedobacter sp. 10938]MEC3879181.1 TIM barrel protein [Parapedobacter sp. 10938]
MKRKEMSRLTIAVVVVATVLLASCNVRKNKPVKDVFAKQNLVAWCVVPFDAKQRGPEERAQMLSDLGITKLAYDWREQHIPTFDDEWRALNKHGIDLTAFWMTSGNNPQDDRYIREIFDFLERNKISTQIWLLMGEWAGFGDLSQRDKVVAMSKPIAYIADRAKELGCQVALYNHGGWFGEPENQLEIIEAVDRMNVGMVYNFHHARLHHERFSTFFPKIVPHLFALNIAGLKAGVTDRFFRTGQGDVEKEMIRQVWKSNYRGPIGIINHDTNEDAEKGLSDEIDGLKKILKEIGNERALATY